jgi:dienelactone hydrolase
VTFPADVRGAAAILAAPNAGMMTARATSAAEEIEFPSAGRTIQGWIVKPPAFVRERRYPLIIDVQDSPRRMCGIELSLRARIFAARGFVVLCANPRGSPGFGEEFGNLLRTRDPGDDFNDLMAGVDYLVHQGLVDPERVHIIGGLLAAWAIGQTDLFRSAVAVDPVVVYGAAPDRSPIFYTGQFHTPTLVIDRGAGTGASDLYSALRARRIEAALVHDLGEQTPTRQAAQMQAILDWFQR